MRARLRRHPSVRSGFGCEVGIGAVHLCELPAQAKIRNLTDATFTNQNVGGLRHGTTVLYVKCVVVVGTSLAQLSHMVINSYVRRAWHRRGCKTYAAVRCAR